ncbi:50S ribosomal protein L11 methyltransferase [Cryomorpha ignava]|uniref:Ribosomal protein L11 methyltransferase n=1 Tax=Cryomorpha ignava TaxID=101383 RepID=A0A7K3WPZ5_9FLAO|nr:50S ribosomal protein L11 methyltransferase [Cryomorpha ignava]NEN23733.1 50S ribosomal protein L11 methyltransferase [Cryomorpha ignava]
MNYLAYTFDCNPPKPLSEILVSQLAEIGFESFEETQTGVVGYVPENLHNSADVATCVKMLEGMGDIKFKSELIPDQNWNAVWESEYPVVTIGDKCIVRAPFHRIEAGEYDLDIQINPQMSFGTGHHETTFLVLSMLLKMDLKNVSLLDMGSGTGVLAIAARKLGAADVMAIDSEDWAYKNTLENVELNNVDIHVHKAETIPQDSPVYDVILANINKNVLVQLMASFAVHLKEGGTLILSGFFQSDIDEIAEKASKYNLFLIDREIKNSWAALELKKENS